MTRTARKKTVAPARGKRRLVIVCLLLLAAVLTTVAVTEPRQLPAVLADHTATRQVYVWRDAVRAEIHSTLYPLSDLRDDTPASATSGAGYAKDDRAALDALLENKESPTP